VKGLLTEDEHIGAANSHMQKTTKLLHNAQTCFSASLMSLMAPVMVQHAHAYAITAFNKEVVASHALTGTGTGKVHIQPPHHHPVDIQSNLSNTVIIQAPVPMLVKSNVIKFYEIENMLLNQMFSSIFVLLIYFWNLVLHLPNADS